MNANWTDCFEDPPFLLLSCLTTGALQEVPLGYTDPNGAIQIEILKSKLPNNIAPILLSIHHPDFSPNNQLDTIVSKNKKDIGTYLACTKKESIKTTVRFSIHHFNPCRRNDSYTDGNEKTVPPIISDFILLLPVSEKHLPGFYMIFFIRRPQWHFSRTSVFL